MAQVVHVVLIEWTRAEGDPTRQAGELVDRHLPALAGVLAVDHGPSVSGEGRESGFDWMLVLRFADEQALADYLPHPEHRIVGRFLAEHAVRLVVFDIAAG